MRFINFLLALTILVLTLIVCVQSLKAGEAYRTCTRPGLFALTFDDGPSQPTEKLLDILKREDVPATFYIIGDRIYWYNHSKILQRAFQEGHEIGTHSWSHPDMAQINITDVIRESLTTDKTVYNYIGEPPATTRPPYGSYDEHVSSIARKLGNPLAIWNLDTLDWQHWNQNPDMIYNAVVDSLKDSDPSQDSWISLQHDLYMPSIDQVEKIISYVKQRGFKMVTMSECLDWEIPRPITNCGDGLCTRNESCGVCMYDCGPCLSNNPGIQSSSENNNGGTESMSNGYVSPPMLSLTMLSIWGVVLLSLIV